MENSKVLKKLDFFLHVTLLWCSPDGCIPWEHGAELLVPFQQGMRRGLETNFAETEYVGSPQQSKMFRTRQLNKGASQISLGQGEIRGRETIYSHYFFPLHYCREQGSAPGEQELGPLECLLLPNRSWRSHVLFSMLTGLWIRGCLLMWSKE